MFDMDPFGGKTNPCTRFQYPGISQIVHEPCSCPQIRPRRIYMNTTINTTSHLVNFNNLSSAMYIAEITLENGTKVIKKGIKK